MHKHAIALGLVALSLVGGAAATFERNFFLRSFAGQPPEAREDEVEIEMDDDIDVESEEMELAEVEAIEIDDPELDDPELDDAAAFEAQDDMQHPQDLFLANANAGRELAMFGPGARSRQTSPEDAAQVELNAKLKKLLREYQQAKPDQRAAMRTDIAEVVQSQFSNKLESQQKRLDRLREEANQIEAHLQKRRELAGAIVERRVKELLGEKDELSWDEENSLTSRPFESSSPKPWLPSLDPLASSPEKFRRDQSSFQRYREALLQDRDIAEQKKAEAEASLTGARREASERQKWALQERKRAMQQQLQEMEKHVERQRLLIEQQFDEINKP